MTYSASSGTLNPIATAAAATITLLRYDIDVCLDNGTLRKCVLLAFLSDLCFIVKC